MLRRINIALLVLQWTVCMAGGKEEAGTWQYVTASNPPAERVAPAVIDAQQRIWIFGGLRYAGRYQGVYKGTAFFNDLHYFDTQARAWHEVTASNAPSERNGHTSVIDAQQRIWVFGGYFYSARFNDLHYFDIQAKVWHEVSAQNAPPGRSYHTAVMDAKQRMWIFGGDRPPGQGGYNDLHYFDIQANTWQEVKASNPPSRRSQHTVVMDAQQQMWIFGDYGGSGTLHYFDIQAKTWQEVKASNAPSKTEGHTAVMDAQQRMWIFGGYNGNANDLHYFDIQAKTWQQVSASNPFERYYHAAVMDMQQRMWIFGGNTDDDDGTRSWNDLRYFDTQDYIMKHQVAVQQRFVVGIVLSVLLTCPFVFLSFGIYRCYRARKLRQGQAAQAAGAPEELQSSPPWPVLPAITSITSITAKPLLFGWNSRMTAEWPRGKVLKLTVGETGFEGKGQRFPFRQADGREFCWEDGTVQRVQKIQKNVVWWRTQHERSEWQHFRWICTPKCSVGGHHDMELTDVDPYRCSSCSSSRVAEKHWHCPSHKVHLCPSCAELPPETPTLGVAANYVVNVFPTLASSATGQENPDFYAICPLFAHGSSGLGVNKICPRDGRPQCSVVDALEDTYSGKVTHFVSWCWAYYLQSVVSAVEGWLHKSGEDPHDVFLWMCFFCNNQYRIKEEATQTGSEDLKSIFESHLVEAGRMLVEAGRMLVLLETIERPVYITRAWCIFESYVCIARDIPMSIILPETAENFFRETVQTGEIRMLTKAVDALNVRDAKASSEADEDLIKKLILNDIGFDRVNNAVRTKLVDSFLELFRELFMQPR